MILRNRFLITAIFACHCFLAPQLLTSQLRSGSSSSGAQILPQALGDDSPEKVQQQDARDAQHLLDQELQSGADEQDKNPRPTVNVPLGRDEVLIQADRQKLESGHLDRQRQRCYVRFRNNTLHYPMTRPTIQLPESSPPTATVVFDGRPA